MANVRVVSGQWLVVGVEEVGTNELVGDGAQAFAD